MLGVYEGVKLVPVVSHAGVRHTLREYDEDVNSYHNYASRMPTRYSLLAKGLDGSVEAIANTERNWHGWMWHPEREPEFKESDIYRVKNIFN